MELLVFSSNTRNHLTVCNQMINIKWKEICNRQMIVSLEA